MWRLRNTQVMLPIALRFIFFKTVNFFETNNLLRVNAGVLKVDIGMVME